MASLLKSAKTALDNRRVLWRQRRELLELLPAAGAPSLLLYGMVLLAATVQPLLVALTTGLVVSRVPAAAANGLSSPDGQAALDALGVLAVVLLSQLVVEPLRNLLKSFIARRINAHTQARLVAAATAPVGVGHLEDRAVLDLVSLGAQPIGLAVVGILDLVSLYLGGIGALAIIARYSWWVAAVMAVVVFTQRSYWRAKGLGIYRILHATQHRLRRADYFVNLALTPAAAKETRIFGLGDWFADRYRRHSLIALQPRWDWFDGLVRDFRWAFPVRFVGVAVPAMMLGYEATVGRLSLGGFTTSMQAAMIAMMLGTTRPEDIHLDLFAPTYPAVKSLEVRTGPASRGHSGGRGADGLPRDAITIEGLCFRYPGRDRPVFDGLELVIPAGRSLAIVGANGAGKTTLVKLLSRLYEPDRGRITVDGIDLADLSVESWRRCLAVVFQDFLPYRLSAADNIAFGSPEQRPTLERLRSAAAGAGVLELIEALPNGWDTVLSREFTGGVDLSGGQWQRVALARALFAVGAGATVLALDEPTANLDVRAEARFFDEFLELTRGLTSIVVSHRFSTVRRADRICVIEQGRVVELGSHDELLEADGRYARLFRLQAARFNGGADRVAEERIDG